MKFLAAVIMTLCSSLALADAPPMAHRKFGAPVSGSTTNFRVLSSVAASASAATRTYELNVSGMSKLSVWVDVTEGGTITAVTNTCSASPNAGTTYGRINSTTVGAGTGTVVNYTDSYATTTSDVALFEYDVRTYDKFKCTVAVTGGGATDTFHVYATAAVGQ